MAGNSLVPCAVKPMRLVATLAMLALVATGPATAATLPLPQQVEIPASAGTLHAQLFKPEGSGPFPTVIALHGCGGLYGQMDQVQPRYRDWAGQLLESGHAVLLPDSYGSRELGPQCRAKERRVLAFAGIGDPQRFFRTLRGCGVEVAFEKTFADHHAFTEGESAALAATAKRDGLTLVTTEKDFARLRRGGALVPELEIVAFAVTLRFHDEVRLQRFVTDRLFKARAKKYR